jgi:hypothetical protein
MNHFWKGKTAARKERRAVFTNCLLCGEPVAIDTAEWDTLEDSVAFCAEDVAKVDSGEIPWNEVQSLCRELQGPEPAPALPRKERNHAAWAAGGGVVGAVVTALATGVARAGLAQAAKAAAVSLFGATVGPVILVCGGIALGASFLAD